ncbi:MAG TPA: ZIP family metal transporter, partial [Clostridia bacterium]|nr:ZIP family metal transporter [Clostridia bacterium]
MTSGEMLLVSTITGLATGIGGLIVISIGPLTAKTISALLGFAAGIMIAISTINLLPSAVEFGNTYIAGFGFLLGVLLMLVLDNFVPHLHFLQKEGKDVNFLKMGYFIASGIALHNLPEGLALGAGYQAEVGLGMMIAGAIFLHNIPEGMGIAAPLKFSGAKKMHIIGITSLAGLFTPLGTLIGILIFGISPLFISVS